MIFRRSFLSALVSVVAGKRRRRKTASRPLVYPNNQLNEIERAQLLAAIPDDRIRQAMDIRFLDVWSDAELEVELARRAVTPKK